MIGTKLLMEIILGGTLVCSKIRAYNGTSAALQHQPSKVESDVDSSQTQSDLGKTLIGLYYLTHGLTVLQMEGALVELVGHESPHGGKV